MMDNQLPNRIFKENVSHQQKPHFIITNGYLESRFIVLHPYEAFDLREQDGSPLFLPL